MSASMQSGTYVQTALERVVYGRPAAQAVLDEVERLGSRRAFLMVSGTLNRETSEIRKVRALLGDRFAGLNDHMPAHTPREAVVAAANQAREAEADLIVTFGGGSVTDGAKVVQICLEHGIDTVDGLEPFRMVSNPDGSRRTGEIRPPKVRQISVPTTLSGGEFGQTAGCTDTRRQMKQAYSHPLLVARSVILDPAATVHTPEWLWLSTGIRAVDHAVETLCADRSDGYADGLAIQALRLLGSGLQRCKADGHDLQARLDCQIGAWLSMDHNRQGIPMGASHGIGHVLGGTCNVPHGHTSCVMLPNVLRWNAGVNGEKQKRVSAALGRPGEDAATVVGDFIASLGMPRSLKEVGVGPDRFRVVAENSMHDRCIHTNPRPIKGPDDVMQILELAA